MYLQDRFQVTLKTGDRLEAKNKNGIGTKRKHKVSRTVAVLGLIVP